MDSGELSVMFRTAAVAILLHIRIVHIFDGCEPLRNNLRDVAGGYQHRCFGSEGAERSRTSQFSAGRITTNRQHSGQLNFHEAHIAGVR